MKRTLIISAVVAFGILLISGCGDVATTEDAGTPFYDAVQEVVPSFTADSSSALMQAAVTTDWLSGNPLHEVFYIFQKFDPVTDQGIIDTSNIRKSIYEAENSRGQCAAITEQAIGSPFAFGGTTITYNCAQNNVGTLDGYDSGVAHKKLDAGGGIIAVEDTTTIAAIEYGLVGFVWPGSHNEYGVMKGYYTHADVPSLGLLQGDASVDIAVWVDYSGADDYCYRNEIRGNDRDYSFTLRSIKGGTSFTSIIGKGTAEGAGNYFLLKITNNDMTGRYYCIKATDGETELRAMNTADPLGSEGTVADPVDSNCANLQAGVDALTAFTTNDLACASSDFNAGGTGTAAEGTIFLNFQ